MAGAIQRMQGIERVNFFGVRHLSPAASWHLLKLLNKLKPKCVLIEGPSDSDYLISGISREEVVPPIAILAYTADKPVSTVFYPFAEYSPEYQAMKWAASSKAEAHFIDLPSGVMISLNPFKGDEKENSGYYSFVEGLYSDLIKQGGENSYDSYWERNFEHNLNEGAYNETVTLHSAEIRGLLEPEEFKCMPSSNAVDLVRESYMVGQIQKYLLKYKPEEIAVVTGAYHTARMKYETMPMSVGELGELPRRSSKLTLMPYSFYRLSSRSGYGAGNSAPEYYQLMWSSMQGNDLGALPIKYISKLGRLVRGNGGYCSTANIIEAVRLSYALTYLKGGAMPTLSDLHDACVACIGHGEFSELATAFALSDIGVAFGYLPEGISQTPVQDDMNRELKRLKLEKYKSTISQKLDLDLRGNLKVKSEEAAFLDLNRSVFLHRLQFLGIGFAQKAVVNQEGATWRESWVLGWSPEVEAKVVESVLKGDTIELAAAFHLRDKLEGCKNIQEAAKLISISYICKLSGGTDNAASVLQALAVDSGDFSGTVEAARELSMVIQYGDIRRFNTSALEPLLQQLFLHACLMLLSVSSCDNKAAVSIADAINTMHIISQENSEIVDGMEWDKALWGLAGRDDKNAKLSGAAFAVLLERGLITDEFCSTEISRRLSPGVPADLGAGWFEGMSMRNHYALLSRINLWRELDNYISSLEDEEFRKALVYMRRAFGGFEAYEKNSIAELLSDFWGEGDTDMAVFIQGGLEGAEASEIDGLNDFDFDM
ncbi:MAG: DUF5682 family protein [Clostridiales bacterium]|jgi:hypothetical protein|nr:DUF5682 family protein [Clostridiales bacterium]